MVEVKTKRDRTAEALVVDAMRASHDSAVSHLAVAAYSPALPHPTACRLINDVVHG
jgi:hypothetical protein